MSDDAGRCGSCKYWRNTGVVGPGVAGPGECRIDATYRAEDGVRVALCVYPGNRVVSCRADFGCVEHDSGQYKGR